MALPRRTSTSSVSSSGSSRVSSPSLTPLDSSAALILVHDEETQSPFHLDSDDDNEDEDSVPQFDVHRTSTPPLSPSLVFLYLLVPYLKLGAMFLPHTETPLNYGLPSLFVFALLAAFARQLLYMLSRYTRSAELEDVVLDLLARGRGKERRRSTIRIIARAGIGGLRALLATVYLRGSHQPVTTAKPSKFRSFELLSVLSVILALLLTLPLVIFSADPSVPETSTAPRYSVLSIIPVLNATTLLLSIPSLIVTVPSLPVTDRLRCSTSFPISKILLLVFVTILALVPSRISAILSDILLLCALTSTYFLPAVLHIIAHFFERPLTILTPRNAQSREGRSGPDELLLRKERALQKKQFRKRIVWDLGVWLLLLGGGAGFVAAIGRVLGTW
ncbi:hypothetical protein C0989_000134 [Termitomyces sp. Mn162]|nr:hypothetical protein C0989_000134 [Termitomyces sp. Mn162]